MKIVANTAMLQSDEEGIHIAHPQPRGSLMHYPLTAKLLVAAGMLATWHAPTQRDICRFSCSGFCLTNDGYQGG